jgi:Ca2+-binding RTX toxin-like protein
MAHLRLGSAVLPLVAVLAAPASAQAATVSYGFAGDDGDTDVLRVTGAGRERNDLVITAGPHRILVRERGAPRLRYDGERCRRRSAKVLSCEASEVTAIPVRAGAGDDRVLLRGEPRYEAIIAGEAGDDRLRAIGESARLLGGEGRDVLVGSAAGDVLLGGRGPDRVYGGPGVDQLSGDAESDEPRIEGRAGNRHAASDLLDGGRGIDQATWHERRASVVVDLAAGRGGRGGTEDALRSIESASGGSGRDVLRGDGGSNSLEGGAAADVLEGRGGRDVIDAGSSTPAFDGGPDDRVDAVSCGTGADLVFDLSLPREPLARDCERVAAREDLRIPEEGGRHLQLDEHGAGRVRIQPPCSEFPYACDRRVTLRHEGRVIGRSRLRRVRGQQFWLTIRLLRPLPATGIVRVSITGYDVGDAESEDRTTRRPFRFTYRVQR